MVRKSVPICGGSSLRSLLSFAVASSVIVGGITAAWAQQTADDIPAGIAVPDQVETRIGTLNYVDGAPSDDTVDLVYDTLDFTRALDAYMNAYQLASLQAFQNGLQASGVEDNGGVMIWSELLDAQSLLLTANADTVYYIFVLDLSDGPMVVETPPNALGVFDDFNFEHVIDFGNPGPDRGQGGRYLLLPPGYDGPLPDDGYFVAESGTNRVWAGGRNFIVNNDPQPAVDTIRNSLKIYPYTPGGYGTSIATILEGNTPTPTAPAIEPVTFVEGTGVAINTLPPSDHTFYDVLNQTVQAESVGSFSPEIMGSLASIGIVHGEEFAPDERMQGILADAAAVGAAAGRSLNFRFRDPEWAYYPDTAWMNMLWEGGYSFETPPPQVTADGIVPNPSSGYIALDSRTAMFYAYTGITPAMIMRLTNVGSQYLIAAFDSDGSYFDGAQTYRVNLPDGIPESNFWSFTVYDLQTRSMLRTPQRYPRAGSQRYPSPAAVANEDGSTDIYFGPELPEGVPESNWIQTLPGKGWWTILRLYSPTEAFFDQSWQPSEIELVQ